MVLTLRRWRQVLRVNAPRRWWQESPFTRESAKETVKPLRREDRTASAEPVCSCAFSMCIFAHETAGAARTRSSLRPLFFWGEDSSTAQAHRAVRIRSHIQRSSSATGSRECAPDDRLRRTIQYSETSAMETKRRGVLDTPPSRSMAAFSGAYAMIYGRRQGLWVRRSAGRRCGRLVPHPRFNSLKKSLPLSSMMMNAGKSSTSMRQIASMPSSGYSTTSTFLMQCSARLAAAPPIEPR